MAQRCSKLLTRRLLVFTTDLTRTRSSFAIQSRLFFWKPKRTFLTDLKKQSVVNEDGSRKAAWIENKPLEMRLHDDCYTTYSSYRRGLTIGKEMLGTRIMENGTLVWKWISYEQAFKTADSIAQALRKIGQKIGEETRISIFSRNRPEWVIADMAIHSFSNVTVPIYDTITIDDMAYIINLADLEVVFVDTKEKTETLLREKPKISILKHIIQFDAVQPELIEKAKKNGVNLYSFEEFAKLGAETTDKMEHVPPKPETVASISFTSGTTGRPKGVILSHQNLCATMLSAKEFYWKDGDDAYLSYLPLAHIYERACTLLCFSHGVKVGFFRGDPQHLLEDIQSINPTTMAAVPRVIDKIHKGVMREVQDNPVKKMILKAAIAYKRAHYAYTGDALQKTWVDKYILAKVQSLLGTNLKQVIVGAAKSDDTALKFMRGAFCFQVAEGYGQTETAGPTAIQIFGDPKIGLVGPPMTCCHIKLQDVPHLGYYANKNGGEILVKGYNVTSGYFKNPEATKEAFTDDGYLKTGDIGKWKSDGSLQIVDRIKNVFKLPQGKFVAPDLVEALYTASRFVQQIYVHGDMSKPWLVAVVVPDPVHLSSYAEHKHNIKGQTIEELCKNEVLIEDVCRHLVSLTTGNNRPRYEGIYGVHLTAIPFSVANDLTTPTMKNKRPKLAAFFKKEIDEMYRKLETKELE